jgi:hypothetical protein
MLPKRNCSSSFTAVLFKLIRTIRDREINSAHVKVFSDGLTECCLYSDSQNRVRERDICIHKAIAQA